MDVPGGKKKEKKVRAVTGRKEDAFCGVCVIGERKGGGGGEKKAVSSNHMKTKKRGRR